MGGCLEKLTELGLQAVKFVKTAMCGDLKLSSSEIQHLQKLTVQGTLDSSLTSCSHECVYTGILSATTSIKDIHVLPIYHAFLLGVFKTFFNDISDAKVKWREGTRSKTVSLRSLLWLYNDRIDSVTLPKEFNRKPIPIIATEKGNK